MEAVFVCRRVYLLKFKTGPTRPSKKQRLSIWIGYIVIVSSWLLSIQPGRAVPITVDAESAEYAIEEDIPEEILRTEIITEARSPLTGEPLSAAEYAQLQAELATSAGTPLVSEDLRYLIFLLQFRRAVKPIIPFL